MCDNCSHKEMCKHREEFENLVETCSFPKPLWAIIKVSCKMFQAKELVRSGFDTGRGGTDEN